MFADLVTASVTLVSAISTAFLGMGVSQMPREVVVYTIVAGLLRFQKEKRSDLERSRRLLTAPHYSGEWSMEDLPLHPRGLAHISPSD